MYLFGVFISAVSQVLLKKSALKERESRIQEYLNPLVITAYAIFFVATVLTIISYRVVPLSLGPILEATSYLYVTAFGVLIFREKLSTRKISALVLIVVGITIYSLSV